MKVTIIDKKGDFYYIVDENKKYYVIEITDENELTLGDTAFFSNEEKIVVDKGISADCLIFAEDVSEDRWTILKNTQF